MSKYLVTGGAGFIGCNIARFLLERGHGVVVLDNFSTGKMENITDILDRIELIEADIRDRRALEHAAKGCAAIFHQAALGSVPRSVEDPITTHDVNVNGTINVLEVARTRGPKRVIYAASSSAYGDQNDSPKHEGMVPSPISPYAASKLAGEFYMRAYAASFGLETLCLRYFNVFGPYQDPEGAYAAVIPAWVGRLLRGQNPIVYGDGQQTRDFCYIDNVCQANWQAANVEAKACDGQALNIACSKSTSLNEILLLLNELLGTKVEAIYQPPRAGDVKHSLADISRAAAVIGYKPEIFFREGLERSIHWYREALG